ncbi:MAG: response regulator [Thermodesulfobacteriota bacterium]
MKNFLEKWYSQALTAYAGSDLDRQLKARFFLTLCLSILAVIVVLAVVVAVIQRQIMGYVLTPVTLATMASFIGVSVCIFLLIRGRFFLATHLFVIIIIIAVWLVIIFDPGVPVVRLNSFIFIVCLMGLMPLIIHRKKSVIIFYGLINIGFLFGFIYFFRQELPIPDYAVVDFLSDNSLALIIACCVASAVFSINDQAIKRAKAEIEERKQGEEIRARLEAQLHQAQKMEAIGQLAGGVAHDFNNMLSVVIGNTELVLMKQPLDDEAREQLSTIRNTVTRSARLIRQLLAFARRQTVVPETLDINETVSDMLPMLYPLIGENITLQWMPGENIGYIMIDPSQIDQVLTNLLVNARDAIGNVGRVTIETRNIVLDQPYDDTFPDDIKPGLYVLLTISDTGCGMSQEVCEQIFEPFFSTKKGMGTGLGLATVYGIVRQNSGIITVYSEPGLGTTFKIYFPVVESREIPEKLNNESSAIIPKGHETILMVEDDQAILKFGTTVLEQLGYTVLAASFPEKALDLIQSGEHSIDLLLTDVIMPGMNGRELAQRIREMMPGISCLYISGYTADVLGKAELTEKGTGFLSKPFTIRELAEKVREALG